MTQLSLSQALELALAHHRAGRLPEAENTYRQILTAFPDQPDALHWLGVIARQAGKLEQSLALIARSLERNPRDPLAHSDMAETLRDMARPAEAIEHYRAAISLRPELYSLHNDLGIVYRHQREYEKAIACFNEALRLNGDPGPICLNLGGTLSDLGRLEEALEQFERSLASRPGNAQALLSKANVLLLKGDLAGGLPLYENRLGNPEIPYPKFTQSIWDGSDFTGKTLAVVAEQGLGDTIMFARYLPLLAERGIRTLLLCDPALAALMRTMDSRVQVYTTGQATPDFDYHVPLLSLPLRMGTTLETIPARVPYLKADPAQVERWRKRLAPWEGQVKVALAWAGSPRHRGDKRRSMTLSQFAPFAKAVSGRDVVFFAIQKGAGAEQTANPPAGMKLIDLAPDQDDFTDTAAALEAMDLLISVDTSVVHVAGALAKPVWTLIAQPPDWRWLIKREDTPWYPTMRLFRQKTPGEWAPVVEQVAKALGEETAG